ncbi:MAG: hypothetical protein H6755_07590 [Candidatus Omnitrophica bacterium]|nr:hypothetical protein [Candidatus Omnitrophota bacterium]MCB9748255.1 hypothetical protein [Candidatus Omnitrophota bacterium]
MIIDFPKLKESFNPHFYFLGSILNKNDFSEPTAKTKQKNLSVYLEDFFSTSKLTQQAQTNNIDVIKPNYTTIQFPKNTPKTIFPIEQNANTELIKKDPEEIIQPPKTTYQHLKFKNL